MSLPPPLPTAPQAQAPASTASGMSALSGNAADLVTGPDGSELEVSGAGQRELKMDSASMGVLDRVRRQVEKVVVGQEEVVEQVLAGLLAHGHLLLEGKPGLGKTHMVLALARTFGGVFRRIQFTPDLMPSDITGHMWFDMGSQTFKTRFGPVFANLLLADEINRAPAKTQAALLEVMQERQVTIDGERHRLEAPFMTLATQNPIEQEGTYPLPEAQLDRFLMKVLVDYPDIEGELSVIRGVTRGGSERLDTGNVEQVATAGEILGLQEACAQVHCEEKILRYAVEIVRTTRGMVSLSLGAGTRGGISLVQVAKGFAMLEGRNYVIPDDIKRGVLPVLRHRVQVAPEVAMMGRTADQVLLEMLQKIAAPA